MLKIFMRVAKCSECPARRYCTGGVYECTRVNMPIPAGCDMPDWCPLPEDPAVLVARTQQHLATAREAAARAMQEAANLRTSAQRLRELLEMVVHELRHPK